MILNGLIFRKTIIQIDGWTVCKANLQNEVITWLDQSLFFKLSVGTVFNPWISICLQNIELDLQ